MDPVVTLTDPRAAVPAIAGAKAANLARCAGAGLHTLPGFVLTTGGAATGPGDPEVRAALHRAWRELAGPTGGPLVVRSSSTVEDAGTSSMAGQFTSVLDVVGWDAFLVAVEKVLGSAHTVAGGQARPQPMAVLVQRQLDAVLGGVMFGADPVTGQRRHLVVEAVPQRPDTLVGGEVTASHYVLTHRGRLLEEVRPRPDTVLSAPLRRRLAAMARTAARAFAGPQDIEWAVDRDGHLWLLQSRPVTAVATLGGKGHVFGPGPVAETFPTPLRALEEDLWLVPLRDGMVRALEITGAVSRRQLETSPVLTTVGGWAAVDLELLGITRGHRSLRSRVSPATLTRRLGAAWRVGRTRAAFPELSATVLATVDRHLAATPPLRTLPTDAVWELLEGTRRELATVHAYEVLAGMLLTDDEGGVPTGTLALHAAAEGRGQGLDDAAIVARWPEVLALSAPTLGARAPLPTVAPTTPGPEPALEELSCRDALRLRTRWLQELAARAACELGRRLVAEGRLPHTGLLRELTRHELGVLAAGGGPPADLEARAARPPGPPLPDAFRLSATGRLMPARHHRPASTAVAEGIPAGGGRVVGTVRHRVVPGDPRTGVVLVVRHLEPSLASVLPSIDGLVAETGSALSHLAILARELDVPTVVGVHDARRRYPPGVRLLLDGTTGEVALADDEPVPDARSSTGPAPPPTAPEAP